MALVTLAVAKAHLLITDSDHDADVALKLAQAEAIILDYLKTPSPGWSAGTVPLMVQASILLMLANLHENRGDAESFGMSGKSDAVWAAIERLLVRSRDPALA